MMLPKLFIGSSREAKNVGALGYLMTELKSRLTGIEIVSWTDSIWLNFESALSSLTESLVEYSYAIFLVYPDDEIEYRGNTYYIPRDNVLFEFGLFLSQLGKERTFLIAPEDIWKVPPKNLPLHILTDIGTVFRAGSYSIIIDPATNATNFSFHIDDVVKAIEKRQSWLAGLLSDNTHANTELRRVLMFARAELHSVGRVDSYYSGKLASELDTIALLKAASTNKTVQDSVGDLLLSMEAIPDLCDIEQLAKEPHYSRGIEEVWVFSDLPLEFSKAAAMNPGYQQLKIAILENLEHDVTYTYFVSPLFNVSNIDTLISPALGNREALRRRITIVKVDARLFKTYFTLHFGNHENIKSVYMSSVMKNRNDVLIQVSDDAHINRIYERIQLLTGHPTTIDGAYIIDTTGG